jgi:hypothetical protein
VGAKSDRICGRNFNFLATWPAVFQRRRSYFIVLNDANAIALEATEGTSFSAPSVLRLGAGLRAHFGDMLSILAIRALLIHTAEECDYTCEEVGRGRVARSVQDIVLCDDDTVRVVYQGTIAPTRCKPHVSGRTPNRAFLPGFPATKFGVLVSAGVRAFE